MEALPWMCHVPAALMEAGISFGRKVAFSENIKIQRRDELTAKHGSDFINHGRDGIRLRAQRTHRADLAEKVWGPTYELALRGEVRIKT